MSLRSTVLVLAIVFQQAAHAELSTVRLAALGLTDLSFATERSSEPNSDESETLLTVDEKLSVLPIRAYVPERHLVSQPLEILATVQHTNTCFESAGVDVRMSNDGKVRIRLFSIYRSGICLPVLSEDDTLVRVTEPLPVGTYEVEFANTYGEVFNAGRFEVLASPSHPHLPSVTVQKVTGTRIFVDLLQHQDCEVLEVGDAKWRHSDSGDFSEIVLPGCPHELSQVNPVKSATADSIKDEHPPTSYSLALSIPSRLLSRVALQKDHYFYIHSASGGSFLKRLGRTVRSAASQAEQHPQE